MKIGNVENPEWVDVHDGLGSGMCIFQRHTYILIRRHVGKEGQSRRARITGVPSRLTPHYKLVRGACGRYRVHECPTRS